MKDIEFYDFAPVKRKEPFFNFRRRVALFFDESGRYVGRKTFGKTDRVFYYKNGAYNINLEHSSSFVIKYPLYSSFFYFYRVNNPDPLRLRQPLNAFIDARHYNAELKTKVINDLNALSRGGFLAELLKPRNVLLMLVVGVAVWYFANGGSL